MSARLQSLRGVGGGAVSVAGLFFLVLVLSEATLATMQLAAIAGALAVSLQVIFSLLGQLSLGNSALFGAGAYAYAVLAIHGHGIVLALIGAGAVGLIAGVLIAAVTMRLGGPYFAVATFALASLGAIAVSRWELTGRDEGLIGVPNFPELPGFTYQQSELLYTGGALLIGIAIFSLFRRTRTGLSLETVKADPLLARSIGINVQLARVVAMSLAGLLAGLAGAVYGQQLRFVSPDVFGLYYIITPLAVVIVGGRDWSAGPIAGCLIVVALPQLLGFSGIANQIFSSAILLVVVLLMPEGVVGGLNRVWRWVRGRGGAEPVPVSAAKIGIASAGPSGAGADGAGAANDGAAADPDGASRPASDRRVLDATGVSVQFGALRAVEDVSLSVAPGEVLGLIGANGAGKSTFVNAVSSLVVPSAGKFVIGGQDVTSAPSHKRARLGLGRTFQQVLVADTLTVRQSLMVARSDGRFLGRFRHGAQVEEAAGWCGLGDLLDVRADALSFMHRRLLTIAMVLVREPSVVMLDEVTAGLSEEERNEIAGLVGTIAARGETGFIVIEHDVAFVTLISDRIAVMDRGRLLVDGQADEVLVDPEVVASYLGTG
jgi:ABC-type branched-subunit amino acid transport system ATPase component/ABC-type branched-subunit amino acid transport system permease subunit